ncbi:rod-binding protein [Sediminispirochaeta bajacaliforniensis]|uniref:rod-binding protein n=1 Tax=Sediminispirochaeta bajacaliforniensis TaxID=148 RepID=UPI00037AADB6|nr:rod-binding protein [Sediminispirochaeta bajacaliforniensis]
MEIPATIRSADRSVPAAEAAARRASLTQDQTKLKKACNDFEALFIKQMFKAMDKTVEHTGLLDGGMAEEYFRDMLLDSYADEASKTSKLGIAEMMFRQLSSKGIV